MLNTYSPWTELGSLPHLELRRESPGRGKLGEYVHHLGLIRLEPRMPRRQARAVLCHELRHHEAGDVSTMCGRANLRQELGADVNAARLLIDVRDLASALIVHEQRIPAMAVELWVSQDAVATRLKHLHPTERHFLRRSVEEWSE